MCAILTWWATLNYAVCPLRCTGFICFLACVFWPEAFLVDGRLVLCDASFAHFYFLPRNARLHSTPQIQGGPRSSPRHLGGGRGVCHKPTRREACPANRNAPRKVGDEKLEQTATECTPAESIRYADTLVNYDCFAVGRYMLYAPHRVDRTAPAVHFACRWYRQAQPTGSTVGVVNDARAQEVLLSFFFCLPSCCM